MLAAMYAVGLGCAGRGVRTEAAAIKGLIAKARTNGARQCAPKELALQCKACHCERGCIDWEAIGYPGDPMKWGSRDRTHLEDLAEAGAGEE